MKPHPPPKKKTFPVILLFGFFCWEKKKTLQSPLIWLENLMFSFATFFFRSGTGSMITISSLSKIYENKFFFFFLSRLHVFFLPLRTIFCPPSPGAPRGFIGGKSSPRAKKTVFPDIYQNIPSPRFIHITRRFGRFPRGADRLGGTRCKPLIFFGYENPMNDFYEDCMFFLPLGPFFALPRGAPGGGGFIGGKVPPREKDRFPDIHQTSRPSRFIHITRRGGASPGALTVWEELAASP